MKQYSNWHQPWLMPTLWKRLAFIMVICLLVPFIGCAQQQEPDNDFTPTIGKALYPQGKGPILLVDGGHHNFHTLDDKFAPFGKLAAMDGFVVRNNAGSIDSNTLKNARILVIANALSEKNTNSWRQPIYPAFTPAEVKCITNWVYNGGSLFLIADHMPFPGAVAAIAAAMGYTMYDGFAMPGPGQKYDMFTYTNGMLKHNKLTDMNGGIDSVVSFTGQAFKIPDSATSVTVFDAKYKVLMPDVAWQFSKKTKMIDANGLSQLAYSNYGKGRVVISGEAVMFTAQKAGDMRFGMNAAIAPHNVQLLLNILEWLSEQ